MSFSSRSFSQHSASQKTMSVYGGAGGYGTRISTSQMGYTPQIVYSNTAGHSFTHGLDIHVDTSEKATLQNLNDRLASYLEKVRKLEKENEQLEKQIREWYSSKTVISHDYTGYLATIADLQGKILAATTLNTKIYLEVDNSKLAADDFKVKYETELGMRQTVEGDIAGLKRVMDDITLIRMDLESQYESLKDERIMLQKNHEEELALLKTQIGGQVNVDVNAPSSVDLKQVMTEIREQYEGLIAKSRKELEMWYQKKITVVEKDVEVNSSSLESYSIEIKDLKSTLQTLQIELQSHLSMKSSLEASLQETQERFAAQLASLQAMVTGLETQKSNLDATSKELDLNYCTLLDIKTRLEAEIVEYRRLLDGEDESSKQVITKTVTVQETYVDGKKVDSTKSVDVEVDNVN